MKLVLSLLAFMTLSQSVLAQSSQSSEIITHTIYRLKPIAIIGVGVINAPAYWEKKITCEMKDNQLVANYHMFYKPLSCKLSKNKYCDTQQHSLDRYIEKKVKINLGTICDGQRPDVVYVNGELVSKL